MLSLKRCMPFLSQGGGRNGEELDEEEVEPEVEEEEEEHEVEEGREENGGEG